MTVFPTTLRLKIRANEAISRIIVVAISAMNMSRIKIVEAASFAYFNTRACVGGSLSSMTQAIAGGLSVVPWTLA